MSIIQRIKFVFVVLYCMWLSWCWPHASGYRVFVTEYWINRIGR